MKRKTGTCTECLKVGDDSEKLIVYETGKYCGVHVALCSRHNNRRKIVNRVEKVRATDLPAFTRMRRMRPERAKIERRMVRAKKNYRASLANAYRCESCGRQTVYVGVSHIISVDDCLNDPQLQKLIDQVAHPEIKTGADLACHPMNFTLECHDLGNEQNCHRITEASKPTSYQRKVRQMNLAKKLAVYKLFRPWLYEELILTLSILELPNPENSLI